MALERLLPARLYASRLGAARLRHRILAAMVALLALTHGGALVGMRLVDDRARELLTAHRLGPAMAAAVEAADRAVLDGVAAGPGLALGGLPDLSVSWQGPGTPAVPSGWVLDGVADAPRPVFVAAPRALLALRSARAQTPAGTLAEALSLVAEDTAAQLRDARVYVQLAGGGWLEFASPRFWRPRTTPFEMVLAGLAALGLALALLLWLPGRLVRPLESLAEQATRPHDRLHPRPLPEDGPEEVASLARAFNQARNALRDLMEGRTHLLAAISHDLRTPATRLRLRAEYVDDDALRAKIMADIDEMAAMVTATLEFLGDDVLREEVEVVAFASLLQSLCDDYADTGAPVTYHEPPPLRFAAVRTIFGGGGGEERSDRFDQPRQLRLAGRPSSLRRAFANLIDNAIKYGERATVSVDADADEIVVDVCDEGPGIPEAEIANVFKPFVRLEGSRNRKTGGSGLGLSIVKSIVEAHQGRIELSNRAGGGLRVRVTLPRML
ncbi:two-component sensor histidine kinase (plasmid) [Azospirillum sp. B510]|uniref:ATP-binding protein n=1 Tax=Azospirillum sp. (strain B510) TaxID=137722 RepID=UPI0001C4BADA|nr:ATP-binding protein [Azospirillum sp. B510]BAI74325.1 two-component sensor histidine kinase [Azospirillum sp. B510]